MRSRENVHSVRTLDLVAGERVQHTQCIDLIAEEFDADGKLLINRDDLDRISAYAKSPARKVGVVAVVLHRDELS